MQPCSALSNGQSTVVKAHGLIIVLGVVLLHLIIWFYSSSVIVLHCRTIAEEKHHQLLFLN